MVAISRWCTSPAAWRRTAPAPGRSRLRSAGAPRRADAVLRLDARQHRAARGERGGVQQLRGGGTAAQRQIAGREAARRRCRAAHLARALRARHAAGRWRATRARPPPLTNCAPPESRRRSCSRPIAQRIAPDWDDVVYVTATRGGRERRAGARRGPVDLVSRSPGPGVIAAVDSADNASHEPFQAPERRAFQGRCIAIVRATAHRTHSLFRLRRRSRPRHGLTIEAMK